jgi:hypothetical protein
MFRIILCLLFTIQSVFGQNILLLGAGAAAGGGSAPTNLQNLGCFAFGSPLTCTFGSSVSSGQTIGYIASTPSSTGVMTITDNCNAGASSNTYTTDRGPTVVNSSYNAQIGHTTAGATSTCTVTLSYTVAGSALIEIYTLSGTSGIDISSVLNPQQAPGTGTNAVTSGAITTTVANDLCYGLTTDASENGGTLSAGTNIAWTLGSQNTSGAIGNEYFVKATTGSITSTFTTTTAFSNQLTATVCYKP